MLGKKGFNVSKVGSGLMGGGRASEPARNPEAVARPEERAGARTVLGPGCSVEGTLVCSGPTRLDGNVSGTLVADDFLLIDRNSTVIADLNVQELIVRGTVRGNIRATKRVALEETARIEGDIETSAIEVRDGAQIIGRIDVARRAPLESPGNTRLENATEEAERKFAEASRAIFDPAKS